MALAVAATTLISLDDPAAQAQEVVGAKAANLAVARAAGLPVLPGRVVPITVGDPALQYGAAIRAADGPGAARLGVDRFPLEPSFEAELARAAELGGLLIARSSTCLDADERWSGAFASIAEVRPDELPTAIRGCWSSLFSADALGRMRAAGVEPKDVRIAVLVQAMLVPDVGGWARREHDDVKVEAVRGWPGPLLGGSARGSRGIVDADGSWSGDLADAGVTRALSQQLADAMVTATRLGFVRIEWAGVGQNLFVLQVDRASVSGFPAGAAPLDLPPGAIRLHGVGASPGRALGRPLPLNLADLDHSADARGRILVLDQPLSQFAPLLWSAAALVCLDGSPAAHLFTVARSLHIPAVVAIDATNSMANALRRTATLVAADGDTGEIVMLA